MIRLLEPWRTRLLWLSLGANLFALPLVAAPMIARPRPMGPPGFDRLIDRLARDLPPTDAAAFRNAMARERPWYELGRERLDAARDGVAASVKQQPFDADAFHAALRTMQDCLRDSSTRFDESLTAALADMSQPGRTRLAESMRQGPR